MCLLLLTLGGCFTMGLWGFDTESKRNAATGAREASYTYDDDTDWSWALFVGRILATPLTLCLDCVTAPVQLWWFGDGSDERPSRGGTRCG